MNTTASTRPGPGLLGVLRCFARRAWLLHSYMIATLILLPVQPQLLRADDPPGETWDTHVPQSCLMAQMSAPSGSTYNSGDSKLAEVIVERHTWLLSTSSLGNTSITEYNITPLSGETVNFSIVSLDQGGFPSSFSTSASTAYDGRCSVYVPMDGAGEVVLQADVTASTSGESTTSSLSFTRLAEGEVWSYSHSEALLSATLSTPDGTTDLTPTTERTAQVHATYDSWDVFTSTFGNTEVRNYYSSPASGANVNWSVESGDGSIANASGTQLDASGDGMIMFTMGSGASILRADIGYLSSTTAAAMLTFTPQTTEQWSLDSYAGSISTTVLVEGSAADPQINADVTYTSWEIWTSTFGGTETRNYSSGPAIDAQVTFSVSTGDGSLGSTGQQAQTISTDANGRASLNFIMGTQESEVTVSASYAGSESSATTSFSGPTGPQWSMLTSHESLEVNVEAAATMAATVPLTATVSYRTWEVWGNDQNSDTEIRNDMTSAALNAPVSVAVSYGNGTVTSASSTDNSGSLAATYTAASQESVVTVGASFTTNYGTVYGSGSVSISNLDTDGDSYSDADETAAGTNPNDAGSVPGGGGGGVCPSCNGTGCTCCDPEGEVQGEIEYDVEETTTVMQRTAADEAAYQQEMEGLIAIYGYSHVPEERIAEVAAKYPLCEANQTHSRRQRDAFSFTTTLSKISINLSTFMLMQAAQVGEGVSLLWHTFSASVGH